MIQTTDDCKADEGTDDATDLLLVCAWCRRVRDARGGWIVRAHAAGAGPVSHGICPACEKQALDAAERRFDRTAAKGDHPDPLRAAHEPD